MLFYHIFNGQAVKKYIMGGNNYKCYQFDSQNVTTPQYTTLYIGLHKNVVTKSNVKWIGCDLCAANINSNLTTRCGNIKINQHVHLSISRVYRLTFIYIIWLKNSISKLDIYAWDMHLISIRVFQLSDCV